MLVGVDLALAVALGVASAVAVAVAVASSSSSSFLSLLLVLLMMIITVEGGFWGRQGHGQQHSRTRSYCTARFMGGLPVVIKIRPAADRYIPGRQI